MADAELLVRILGLGRSWSMRPGKDPADPLRLTKRAAYFNTTGLPAGSQISRFWTVPGFVRFNGNSGLSPHEPLRAIGAIFACAGVTQHSGHNRLLAVGTRNASLAATHCLLAIDNRTHGRIDFSRLWCNGATVVAASEHKGEQQTLLLLATHGQLLTSVGTWSVRRLQGRDRMVLTDEPLGGRTA